MTQSSRIERQIANLIRSTVDPALIDSNSEAVTGKPDLASRYAKVAVFVDGCYWHGCLDHTKDGQAAGRRTRDEQVNAKLRERGWSVLRVWEHEEWLAPFVADAASAINTRAAERRVEVLAHLARHASGEWCRTCEMWPHASVTRDDGWCGRCMVHARDHAYDATDAKLFGPAVSGEQPDPRSADS